MTIPAEHEKSFVITFLYTSLSICFVCLKEPSHRDTSLHMFLLIKKEYTSVRVYNILINLETCNTLCRQGL